MLPGNTIILSSTHLPSGKVLPIGITIPGGTLLCRNTILPIGITIPGGTLLHCNTILPGGIKVSGPAAGQWLRRQRWQWQQYGNGKVQEAKRMNSRTRASNLAPKYSSQ